jgi:hypothetical protein
VDSGYLKWRNNKMPGYRRSRNIEVSLIDYFRAELISDGWNGIQVEKSIKQSEIKLPAILIYCSDTATQKKEIGGSKYIKFPTVTIRIYAENDGQRLDLADWLLEKLEGTINYYTYVISGGQVTSKTLAGGITITKIIRNEKELSNTDPENLEYRDRYRHNITISCFIGE